MEKNKGKSIVLIPVAYSSMNLLSDVSGLKTSLEKLSYISSLLKGQEGLGSKNLITQNGRDIEFCIQALSDDNPGIRTIAAEALGKIGDIKAKSSPVKNPDDPSPEVRWAVADAPRMSDKQNSRKEPCEISKQG